jgi:putative ABC transport system permease protein
MSRDRPRDRQLAPPRNRFAVDREVAAELDFHLQMTMSDLMNQGMSERDARAEAASRFGDRASVDAACRQLAHERDRHRSRVEYLSELRQDAVFALRQLARSRTFAIVAICTLALGIGATACVFSLLDAVVLRPLPFNAPDRVVTLLPTKRGVEVGVAAGAELTAMRKLPDIFDAVAATVSDAGFTFSRGGEPVVVSGGKVTSDFLRVFGLSPILGRGFLPADDQPGAPHVVLLSHRMWVRDFAGDANVLGRSITLDGERYDVIGVLPQSMELIRDRDALFVPMQLTSKQLDTYGDRSMNLVARLAPGATLARANAAATTAEERLAQRFPTAGAGIGMEVHEYQDDLVGSYRDRLLVLLGAVGFVLLIACVNVANLLLSRGTARAKELAIRAALGAGRGRLVRQLLVESLVLGVAGAALGVAVAYGLLRGFVLISPSDVPRIDQARIDGWVLAFTLVVAVASGLLIGLIPAVRSATAALNAMLREGGRWSSGGGRDRLRAVLVACEVALAMTLLTGAGLLIRTAISVQRVDPGFTARRIFAGRLMLPAAQYPDSASDVDAFRRIDDAVARVPGVTSAALVSLAPLSGEGHMTTSAGAEGSTVIEGDRPSVDFRLISPGYFATFGIPLAEGRDFARTDAANSPPVAIVSKSLAKKLWPGESAVGKRVDALGATGHPNLMEVVGVVGDLHDLSLATPIKPAVYLPYTQTPGALWNGMQRSLVVVAQTAGDPHASIKAIHAAVMSVDASLPFASEYTMDQLLHSSVAAARFNTLLLSALGTIALLLASVGIYGVVSFFVSQRTQEIGVRLALGALPRHIWRLVLGRGLLPIAGGAAVGMVLSLATTRLLRGQLYGIGTNDPITLIGVALLLLLVAVAATLIPARRAMRVPPVVALQGT